MSTVGNVFTRNYQIREVVASESYRGSQHQHKQPQPQQQQQYTILADSTSLITTNHASVPSVHSLQGHSTSTSDLRKVVETIEHLIEVTAEVTHEIQQIIEEDKSFASMIELHTSLEDAIPDSVLLLVLSFLDATSLCSCYLINTTWCRTLERYEDLLWKDLCCHYLYSGVNSEYRDRLLHKALEYEDYDCSSFKHLYISMTAPGEPIAMHLHHIFTDVPSVTESLGDWKPDGLTNVRMLIHSNKFIREYGGGIFDAEFRERIRIGRHPNILHMIGFSTGFVETSLQRPDQGTIFNRYGECAIVSEPIEYWLIDLLERGLLSFYDMLSVILDCVNGIAFLVQQDPIPFVDFRLENIGIHRSGNAKIYGVGRCQWCGHGERPCSCGWDMKTIEQAPEYHSVMQHHPTASSIYSREHSLKQINRPLCKSRIEALYVYSLGAIIIQILAFSIFRPSEIMHRVLDLDIILAKMNDYDHLAPITHILSACIDASSVNRPLIFEVLTFFENFADSSSYHMDSRESKHNVTFKVIDEGVDFVLLSLDEAQRSNYLILESDLELKEELAREKDWTVNNGILNHKYAVTVRKYDMQREHLERNESWTINTARAHHFFTEISVLSLVPKHKNIVKLVGFCLETPCIVTRQLSRCLFTHLKAALPLVNRAKLVIAIGVCKALSHFHHFTKHTPIRDLKTESILFEYDPKRLKVTDVCICNFGSARMIQAEDLLHIPESNAEERRRIIPGSYPYKAPECYQHTDIDLLNSTKVDVFAFGVVLYELFAECIIPVSDEDEIAPLDFDNIHSIAVENLIKHCIAIDPTERPDLSIVLQHLEHLFTVET